MSREEEIKKLKELKEEVLLKEYNKLNERIKTNTILGGISLALGTAFTTEFIRMINYSIPEGNYSELHLAATMFGTAFFDTAALELIPNTIKDIYNRKLYEEEISSYQKRLK